jgi:hypothetical protein
MIHRSPFAEPSHGPHRAAPTAFALLAAAMAMIVPAAAHGATLTVDNGHTCPEAHFTTIQSAVDAAHHGDRIRVCHGTYREFVHVTTYGIQFFTHGGATIESPSTAPAPDTPVVWLDTAVTQFLNFVIKGDPTGAHCATTLLISGHSSVKGNTVTGTTCNHPAPAGPYAMVVSGSGLISNTSISNGARAGVLLTGSPLLRNDTISASGDGVVFAGRGVAGLQDTRIANNSGTGLTVAGGTGRPAVEIRGSRIEDNGFGVSVGSPGTTRGIYLEGSGVFDNANGGIANHGSKGASFANNRALGNGGFDCFDQFGTGGWSNNVGVTDSPSNICRAP